MDANTVGSGANGTADDRTHADAHADTGGMLSDANEGACDSNKHPHAM